MPVEEIQGDMFALAGPTASFAHCISADAAMGKGIAVLFRNRFGGVDDIKRQISQGPGVGGVAVLERDGRYVYNMVTKGRYFQKPVYTALDACLRAVLAHALANHVTLLAMPRIGCGLDRLDWNRVKGMIGEVFAQDTGVRVQVYYL